MEIRPIRTDKDHRAALKEIEACWGALKGSKAGDKLDVLVTLVEAYEEQRWPIVPPKRFDAVGVLQYAIDELGLPLPNCSARARARPKCLRASVRSTSR